MESNHSENSVYIKFIYKGKTLVYSGDMSYDENITKFANNSDLLILECGWPDKYKMGHLGPTECGILAQKANTKKLILTHFYPPMERVNIKKIVSKYYKGPIIVAKDLMQIKI